jgi:hypothetical protein
VNIPLPLLYTAIGLFVVDAALRPWKPVREEALGNALYLLLAYVPMLLFPELGPWELTAVLAALALFTFFNYARMVGLTSETRYFFAAALSTLAFYGVARVHWYNLFQAMPAFTVFGVVVAAALRHDPSAFLQKLCLAWLGMLVFGYLGAHGALFPDLVTHPIALGGGLGVAVVILLSKCADICWVLARKLRPQSAWLQIWVSPLGGALGGAWLGHLFGLEQARLTLLGAIIGLALGVASRAYQLIVVDVTGAPPSRPLKGTMLFGFSFALALAYHYIRFFWTGAGPVPGGS